MNKIGIYKITNLANNKIYIGSTNNFTIRKQNHLYQLRHNKHNNIYLQRAFNKYKESNFKFELIKNCNENNLLLEEQFLINNFDSTNPLKGYNICKIAGRTSGVECSDIKKVKISNANKKVYRNGFTETHIINLKKSYKKCPRNNKKIFQYDLNLNLIKIWNSGAEASRFFNKSSGSICRLAQKGRIITSSKPNELRNFIFSYTQLQIHKNKLNNNN